MFSTINNINHFNLVSLMSQKRSYTSYNPLDSSPEEFFRLFRDSSKHWQEFGFFNDGVVSGDSSDSPLNILYSGGKRKGVIQDAYAVVTVYPYSTRLTFRKGKVEDIGSVTICSPDGRDRRLALTDLQSLTGIKLRKLE